MATRQNGTVTEAEPARCSIRRHQRLRRNLARRDEDDVLSCDPFAQQGLCNREERRAAESRSFIDDEENRRCFLLPEDPCRFRAGELQAAVVWMTLRTYGDPWDGTLRREPSLQPSGECRTQGRTDTANADDRKRPLKSRQLPDRVGKIQRVQSVKAESFRRADLDAIGNDGITQEKLRLRRT